MNLTNLTEAQKLHIKSLNGENISKNRKVLEPDLQLDVSYKEKAGIIHAKINIATKEQDEINKVNTQLKDFEKKIEELDKNKGFFFSLGSVTFTASLLLIVLSFALYGLYYKPEENMLIAYIAIALSPVAIFFALEARQRVYAKKIYSELYKELIEKHN